MKSICKSSLLNAETSFMSCRDSFFSISSIDFKLKFKPVSTNDVSFSFQGPSIWAECWKEFKFAVDIRQGDTKPVEKEEESDSSSSSSSDSKSDDHYGVITEPDSPIPKKSKSDSAYAVFNESAHQNGGKKH